MSIGVLGGGQLGRMMGLAGVTLGKKFLFLDPSQDACARQVGELTVGAYDDEARLAEISARSEVVTYEFENVPLACARYLAERTTVYPPPRALEVSQDRFVEKTFLASLGIPTPRFAKVDSLAELESAAKTVGLPGIVKTRRFGYDGKGQLSVDTAADLARAFAGLGAAPLILEERVKFARECSMLAVREIAGDVVFYPLMENTHRGGILALSRPRPDDALSALAQTHARKILEALDYVGVLAVEFFVVDGSLVVNEMAPRVHNSGHYSIEGAETSQFENHVRAICGLPLGSTRPVGASLMVNVLGDVPHPASFLAVPGAHVHLYGKSSAPARKVGHVTLRAADDAALADVLRTHLGVTDVNDDNRVIDAVLARL